jgi:uncharacterized protein YhhL (DUF1145 family)
MMKNFFNSLYGPRAGISIGLILISALLILNIIITGSFNDDFIQSWSTMFLMLCLHGGGLLILMGTIRRGSKNQKESHRTVLFLISLLHILCLALYSALYILL